MDRESNAEESGGPLTGLRIVEMTTAIQGPAAGVYLSDMGAAIVKIEPPLGELNRYLRGPDFDHPVQVPGAQYCAMNRGKRSLCLDIHTPLGQSVVMKLLDDADVFLTNYRRSALERMGLGYEGLRARNPRLIYAAVNGFGSRGPDADKAMLDGAAQARGGLANVSGPADGPPMPPGAAIADSAGAMQLVLGVMTALYARERTGVGQIVETSGLGAQLWLQMWEVLHSSMTGVPLQRSGTHLPTLLGPYGVYATADGGAFMFAVAMDEASWDAFWIFAEMPEVSIDPRWNTPVKRLGSTGSRDGVEEIRSKVRQAFAAKTTAVWEEFLASQPEIIHERVQGYDEVLADPQIRANDYLATVDLPDVGPTRFVGNLVHLSETPGSVKGPPPALGQHTAEVMESLGFSSEEVQAVETHASAVREKMIAAIVGE
jgi:crotonobetainyl-CoA:carnitine CoA-transferase CaiB-like acyl-CoA transferase